MSSKLIRLINGCVAKNIPVVSYRLSGSHSVTTFLLNSGRFSLYGDIREAWQKSGFIYAPFHRRTNYPVVLFEPELILENDQFAESLIGEIEGQKALYPDYHQDVPYAVEKNEYLRQASGFFQSFIGDFRKAVLSRVELVRKPHGFDPGKFFIRMQQAYPQAFCHFIHIPGNGTWAGATPEILIRIHEDTATTISLAGTRLRNERIPNGWQEKEFEEQAIVTEYIEKLLLEYGIREYTMDKIQPLEAGNLLHLATILRFDAKHIRTSFGDFIGKLHPTPAVCGYPKEKALDLILDTELHNREYYAGYCGTMNREGETNLFVNLRCVKILPDHLAFYAGGGLTAHSVPEKEWEETVHKIHTLLSLT